MTRLSDTAVGWILVGLALILAVLISAGAQGCAATQRDPAIALESARIDAGVDKAGEAVITTTSTVSLFGLEVTLTTTAYRHDGEWRGSACLATGLIKPVCIDIPREAP